mgnify:CR=1 FL=1
MELVWKDIDPVRLVADASCTVYVEGMLPPPEGRSVREVLDSTAQVEVEEARIEAEKVDITGGITVRIIARDNDGSVFAFESYAGFVHSIDAEGAASGMEARITPNVTSLYTEAAPEGAKLTAEVELAMLLTSSAPMRVISAVNGANDLELKTCALTHTERKRLGSETLRMREELAEASVAQVISCNGLVMVRDITAERDGVSVSGVLTVSAVTADGEGHIGSIMRQVPFREKLGIETDASDIYCTAQLDSVAMHTLGEEFALMTMEAEITFTLYGRTRRELILPTDAFSPTVGFDCLPEEIGILNDMDRITVQTQFKEAITLPESTAEIAAPLFAAARPVVTSVESGKAQSIVNGIFATTLVYESIGGNIYTYTEDVPFSLPIANELGCNMPRVSCKCGVQPTGSADRTVQLAYTVQFDAEMYSVERAEAVVGLAEKEPPQRREGLIVAFASQGDTVFDIAKRYSVPCAEVKKLNPDAKEPFREGESLMMLI